MNRRYELIQDLIKNIEKVGANGYFFPYLIDENIDFWIRTSIYDKLADIMGGIDEREFHTIELAYGKLEEDKKQKVFNEFISCLKSTFLDFKREKIQLISKKELIEIIECKKKIAKIYRREQLDIRLLKSGFKGESLHKVKTIRLMLGDWWFKLSCLLDIMGEHYVKLELNGFGDVEKQCKENETYYEFIIRAIDKINEENKFVEFVWDKDEE